MADISIDTSQVRELAADMSRFPEQLNRWVIPVVEKGALNIKNQMRADASDSAHFRGMASAISYDMVFGGFGDAGTYEAQIGPSSEPGSPGNLANIAYFGTSRGGGTVPDPVTALQAEAPGFEQALAALMDELL